MPSQLSSDISRSYYVTTSSRGHVADEGYYKRVSGPLIKRIGPWLPKDPTTACLDIGCGCGELLFGLQSVGFSNLAGVDIDRRQIDEAARFVNARLSASDVLAFLRSTPSQTFGFVTAFNVLEHFERDVLSELLTEIRRVTKPGGAVVAMVPNALSSYGSLTRHWDLTHEWAFAPNNFRQLLPITGFTSAAFRECGPMPHGLVSASRFCLWQVIRAATATRLLIELGNAKGGIYTMDMLVRLT
jgi:2-polyprenyl-3-methyl-5-hydroxy-6-metoxy-1,4-benzoquinol methylase